jgi:hypothetical protein
MFHKALVMSLADAHREWADAQGPKPSLYEALADAVIDAQSGKRLRPASILLTREDSNTEIHLSSPHAASELADESRQVGVDDLLGTGDFLELAVVGWPAHPLRFGM